MTNGKPEGIAVAVAESVNVGEGCTTIVDGISIVVAVLLPIGVMLCGVVKAAALDELDAFVEVVGIAAVLVADSMVEVPAEVPLVGADVSVERLGEADAVVEAAVPVVKLV
jgi:hypothetical protein